ncbi:MAG: GTPase ObgE, partial [Candidatus Latescibacteria bacterium]|nr:GTPase ObgE [Candidatus Latescibacterota bacterium]
GNGSHSFRREKYVPRGGPDGGDGGNGGDLVFTVDPQLNTLLDYRYQQHINAQHGEHGAKQRKSGKRGQDAVIPVPPGTLIKDGETGEILADLLVLGQSEIILEGGRGGRGNVHFASPTNRTPERADDGREGQERYLELELKLIADVGLVGHPNAGKSTLLSRLSSAHPKIADYPFTTLQPNLGIVKYDTYESLVMADIPGLIEGAHEGKGLGMQFLRHVERTRILLFMIDVTSPDPKQDLEILKNELKQFSPHLLEKPSLLIATKIDQLPPEEHGGPFLGGKTNLGISSVSGKGLDELIRHLGQIVSDSRQQEISEVS